MEAADIDNDGAVNINDPVGLLNFLFGGGVAPAVPGPDTCGRDPDPPGATADLGCNEYRNCP